MYKTYTTDQGNALQKLYEKTVTKPKELDEKQLKRAKDIGALTDALGLLVQLGAALGGGDVRERKFSETATGIGALKEKELRTLYSQLEKQYNEGILNAKVKDYQLNLDAQKSFRNYLENTLRDKRQEDLRIYTQQQQWARMNEQNRLAIARNAATNKTREKLAEEATKKAKILNDTKRYIADANNATKIAQQTIRNQGYINTQQIRNAGANERQILVNQANNTRHVNNSIKEGATPQRAIKDDYENMTSFEENLTKAVGDFYVTSRYRKDAKTNEGEASRHATIGGAIDISPTKDKDGKVKAFLNSDEGKILLFQHRLGFMDETLPENRKYAGKSGPSYHIGTDTRLVNANDEWVKANYPDVYMSLIPEGQKKQATRATTGTRATTATTATRATVGAAASKNKVLTFIVPHGTEGASIDKVTGASYKNIEFTPEEYNILVLTAKNAFNEEENQKIAIKAGYENPLRLKDDEAVKLYVEKINPSILYPMKKNIELSQIEGINPYAVDNNPYRSGLGEIDKKTGTTLNPAQGQEITQQEKFPTPPDTITKEEAKQMKEYINADMKELDTQTDSEVTTIAVTDAEFVKFLGDNGIEIPISSFGAKPPFGDANIKKFVESIKNIHGDIAKAYKEWLRMKADSYSVDEEHVDEFEEFKSSNIVKRKEEKKKEELRKQKETIRENASKVKDIPIVGW